MQVGTLLVLAELTMGMSMSYMLVSLSLSVGATCVSTVSLSLDVVISKLTTSSVTTIYIIYKQAKS